LTTLQEIMTDNVVEVKPTDTLLILAKKMKENDVGFLPVVDNELRGVVTDRDIVCKGLASNSNVDSVEAQQIMAQNTITGEPDMEVDEASQLMQEHQISRLIVTENNQVKGVVSLRDLSLNQQQTAGDALNEIKQSS
jgi:CBS domain-containing protein